MIKSRRRRRLRRRGIVTIAALAAVMLLLVQHTCASLAENGHRSIAERITRALTLHDLKPVATMFPDTVVDELMHDVRLGAIAEHLNALGELREVRFAGHGAFPDTQVFVATFTHGTIREQVSFKEDRVIGFALLPSDPIAALKD